jgi:hypothetical protein
MLLALLAGDYCVPRKGFSDGRAFGRVVSQGLDFPAGDPPGKERMP